MAGMTVTALPDVHEAAVKAGAGGYVVDGAR
jgi:hypothetical protein